MFASRLKEAVELQPVLYVAHVSACSITLYAPATSCKTVSLSYHILDSEMAFCQANSKMSLKAVAVMPQCQAGLHESGAR